eukprot:GFUD01031493.1.p1 GENE.GFUD01031493.1~~GFUD01031493.1.p1  ORF type:complete len:329 (+),score=76.10 GFUD01031493.1:176-1162(+)
MGSLEVFSVLTWNIWFGSRSKWDRKEDRWNYLLDIVVEKDPDVAAFQECTEDFLAVVERHTEFKQSYKVVNKASTSTDYFVMLFVKKDLEIVASKTIKFPVSYLGRNCESVTVRKEKSLFRLGTSHIESYETVPGVRQQQLNTIFNALLKWSNNIEMIFVLGDFNFGDCDKDEKAVEESGFGDTWRIVHGDDPGFTFDMQRNWMKKRHEGNKENYRSRLDRILYLEPQPINWVPKECLLLGTETMKGTGGTESGIPLSELFPSDHFGLLATFDKVSARRTDNTNKAVFSTTNNTSNITTESQPSSASHHQNVSVLFRLYLAHPHIFLC